MIQNEINNLHLINQKQDDSHNDFITRLKEQIRIKEENILELQEIIKNSSSSSSTNKEIKKETIPNENSIEIEIFQG